MNARPLSRTWEWGRLATALSYHNADGGTKMNSRIAAIFRKETREILRDRCAERQPSLFNVHSTGKFGVFRDGAVSDKVGELKFQCQMGTLRGKLIVE